MKIFFVWLQSPPSLTWTNIHTFTFAIFFRFSCDTHFIIYIVEKSLLFLSAWLDLCGFDSATDFTQSGSGEYVQGRVCMCVTDHRFLALRWRGSFVYMAFFCLNHISDFQWRTPQHSSSLLLQLCLAAILPYSLTSLVITCQNVIHALNGSKR